METKPRITGTEMEWGTLARYPYHSSTMTVQEYLSQDIIDSHLPYGLSILDHYLSNGGRFYFDNDSKLEYCTPEDTSFWGTVINELAGEEIAYQLMQNLKDDEIIGNFWLNKRLIDKHNNSWGHHENYLADGKKMGITKEDLIPLAVHLYSRSIFTGAGYFKNTKLGKEFLIAQKASVLTDDFGNQTVGTKALVNLRDVPYSEGGMFRRIHVTSGDANMSPWAMWMNIGTTALVVRLIENNVDFSELIPKEEFIRGSRIISRDTSLTRKIQMKTGKYKSALETQKELVNKARQFQEKHSLSDEETAILDEWEDVLNDLATGDLEKCEDRIDWIAKLHTVEKIKAKNDGKIENDKIENIDMTFDEISLRGIGVRLRKTLWAEHMPSREAIVRAITNPPETTRAKPRGEFVKEHCNEFFSEVKVWDTLFDSRRQVMTKLSPYQTVVKSWKETNPLDI